MGLLELFLLAVGLSMDAFAVSVCKGLSMKKVTLKSAVIVGGWFGFFQAIMPLIGYFLGSRFYKYIVSIDHWIAFILLCFIGANMIKEAFSDEEDEALSAAKYIWMARTSMLRMKISWPFSAADRWASYTSSIILSQF